MAGERLGKYRLLRLLATGGMGEVFLAEQEGPQSFTKRVVVKRLLRHLATDPSFVDMFLHEARVAALIAHPNVVHILELGEEGGTYFIAMEYVRGRSLREILRKLKPAGVAMPPHVAVAIMIDVLHGLHAAHTLVDHDGQPRGCVHRDVSAENVLVSLDGAVKLVDFGIAKALDASTARGTMLRGKYGYMAPEQYLRQKIDAHTDVFASGVLLHELLTGVRPFDGDSEAAVMHAVLQEEPTPLEGALPDCPPRLASAVRRALSKAPDARFPSAEAMAGELDDILASEAFGRRDPSAVRDFARAWTDEEPSEPKIAGLAAPAAGTARLEPVRESPDDLPTVPTPTTSRASKRVPVLVFFAGVLATAFGATALRQLSRAHESARPEPAPSAAETAAAVPLTAPAPNVVEPPKETSPLTVPPSPSTSARPRPTKRGAPATPPSAEKSAGVGTLAFRIRPWAEVFVDGRSMGISPIAPVDVSAGKHHVVLRNKDLGKERTLTPFVARGETTSIRIDLFE